MKKRYSIALLMLLTINSELSCGAWQLFGFGCLAGTVASYLYWRKHYQTRIDCLQAELQQYELIKPFVKVTNIDGIRTIEINPNYENEQNQNTCISLLDKAMLIVCSNEEITVAGGRKTTLPVPNVIICPNKLNPLTTVTGAVWAKGKPDFEYYTLIAEQALKGTSMQQTWHKLKAKVRSALPQFNL